MKIVITHRSTIDRVGGVATFIFELADAFIKKGNEVYVVVFSANFDKEKIRKMYYVDNIPRIISLKNFESTDIWPPRGTSLRDLSVWFIRGSRVIAGLKPDLVIINGIVPLLKRPNTKFIAVVHMLCPHVYQRNARMLFGLQALYKNIPNKIVSITAREKKCLEKYLHVNPRNIEVIPICLNTRGFKYIDIEDREEALLHIGTSEAKNLYTTLKVFRILCKIKPELKLYVTGYIDKESLKSYEKILTKECKDKVKFLGYIDRKELLELYGRVKVLLAPSLFEGLPYAALEAMAHGTPAVTSVAVPKEIVVNGVTGYRIRDPKDSISFAKYVHLLLTKKDLWKKMSLKAREHAERFDCSNIVDQYLDLLTTMNH